MPETPNPQSRAKGRIWKILSPILAGFCLDTLDFFTAGPLGLSAGFIIGFLVTLLMGRMFSLSNRRCFGLAVAAGVYCMLPFTEVFPCATIVMTLVKLLAEDEAAS